MNVLQYPSGNPKDEEINDYALPILIQETTDQQSAGIDMVSGATVHQHRLHPVAAERDRPGRPVSTRPPRDPRRHGDRPCPYVAAWST